MLTRDVLVVAAGHVRKIGVASATSARSVFAIFLSAHAIVSPCRHRKKISGNIARILADGLDGLDPLTSKFLRGFSMFQATVISTFAGLGLRWRRSATSVFDACLQIVLLAYHWSRRPVV